MRSLRNLLGAAFAVAALLSAPADSLAKPVSGGPNGTLGIFTPFDFGAQCNGVDTYNDAIAIQQAINAAALSNYANAEVYLPSGTCTIGTTLTVPTGLTLRGAGPGSTILKSASTLSGDLLTNANSAASVTLQNLLINGNSAAASSATNCIDLTANSVRLIGVDVTSCKADGIKLNGSQRGFVASSGSHNNTNHGLEIAGSASEITITGSIFHDNGQGGAGTGDGINLGSSASYVTLSAVSSYDDQGGSATQRYGLAETAPISSTVTITAAGSSYTTPTCAIAAPGGTGTTATCTAHQTGGAIDSITVTNAGSGYTTAPSCAIAAGGGGGSGATCTTALGTSTNNTQASSLVTSGNVTAGTNFLGANSGVAQGITLPVNVANGGTGLTSCAASRYVLGTGTSAMQCSALGVNSGLTAHGVAVAENNAAFAATAAGTSGQPLLSGGASADPAYGTLGVGGGGTGAASLTSFGVLCMGSSTVSAISPDASTTKVLTSGGSNACPTWAAPATSNPTLISGSGVQNISNATFYVGVATNGVEADVQIPMTQAVTLTKLYASVVTAAGAGQSYTFTVRKGGTNTAITCAISGASATSCNDTGHSASFAAGDLYSVSAVGSATAANNSALGVQTGT